MDCRVDELQGSRMAKHEGVWIMERRGHVMFRWREGNKRVEKWASAIPDCKNSDTGNVTMDLCEAWAVKQAKKLRESGKREAGAPVPICDAVAEYFMLDEEGHPKVDKQGKLDCGLRKATYDAYSYAINHFKAWAARKGLITCDKLTPGLLAQFRVHVTTLKKREPQKGKGRGRGAREEGAAKLSPTSRNLILRGVHTFLNYIRRLDYTPEIDKDAIGDRLHYFDEDESVIKFLQPGDIEVLLSAAARHDAETWRNTRQEHAGEREAGSTPRYDPIRPFLLACLLTGGRFQEVAGLRWDEIDLKAGTITLDPKRVKTKKGRVIRLKTSPLLWEMLRAMKLQAAGSESVFNMTRDRAESARKRLMRKPGKAKQKSQRAVTDFGAPAFTWHTLRRTAGTFLANMANANLKHVADYLGHAIAMAERLYWGAVEVDSRAANLEQAMGIVPLEPPAHAAQLQKVGA